MNPRPRAGRRIPGPTAAGSRHCPARRRTGRPRGLDLDRAPWRVPMIRTRPREKARCRASTSDQIRRPCACARRSVVTRALLRVPRAAAQADDAVAPPVEPAVGLPAPEGRPAESPALEGLDEQPRVAVEVVRRDRGEAQLALDRVVMPRHLPAAQERSPARARSGPRRRRRSGRGSPG